jgi:uncharacterized membrane protein YgcG
MSRPTDWSAAGWDRDPVPGDSAVVATTARQYRQTAEAVGSSITNLDRIDGANMTGQAITAVLDRIKTVRGQLDSVEGRVAGAAAALEIYHPVLATSQADSLAALHEAEGHRAEEQRAVRLANEAAHRHNTSNDPALKSDAKADYDRATDAAGRAAASLRAAREKIQNAVAQRDTAAERAITYLKDIDAQSPVHDSWWDKFTDACGKAADWIEKNLKPLLEKLQKILDIASIVCTVAAAVLMLTGVGAPVAAFLLAASKVLGAISLGISVFNTVVLGAMKALSGRQSWGEFIGSSLLLAGSFVAKRFLGRKLTDAGLSGLGKVAMAKKDTFIRAAARWACNHEMALTPLIKKAAGKVAGKIVDGTVAAGTWAYENIVQPVTAPQQVPQHQYRREYCGGSSGAGAVGYGGGGFSGGGGSGGW